MTYRIIQTKRLGFDQSIGYLFSKDGRCIAKVEAWSVAGCLTALRAMAKRLAKAA